ncbi:ATP-binding cassette domain-containing protein [Micromonospora craniellae]|uniref:ATP-binding cassette domain-containing protein n=1 Tax=Micromonospora craniellae TaxID=2294034 RepID=UPI001CC4914A|nr:ATP-binding cassette domain-containing protein [Micromonospora craniellae]
MPTRSAAATAKYSHWTGSTWKSVRANWSACSGRTAPATLRVGEVVDFVSAHYPDPIPRGELLDRFGLTEQVRRQTGGQKRRLAVALAFVGRPRLVLLDEPTTGLDVEARHTLWEAIRSVHADHASPAGYWPNC